MQDLNDPAYRLLTYRWYPSATLMPDGRMLIASGQDQDGQSTGFAHKRQHKKQCNVSSNDMLLRYVHDMGWLSPLNMGCTTPLGKIPWRQLWGHHSLSQLGIAVQQHDELWWCLVCMNGGR